MPSCVWKSDLPAELNSAFSNYSTASPGITGVSNLSRSWPTKWKMSKAARGKGVTRKLCKVLRVTQWHHQWIQTVIKAITSIGKQEAHRGRKQVRGNLILKWSQFRYQFQANSDTSGTRISLTPLRITTAQRWNLRGSLPLQVGVQCSSHRLQHVDPGTEWFHLKDWSCSRLMGQHQLSCTHWQVMWDTALHSLQKSRRPLENMQRKGPGTQVFCLLSLCRKRSCTQTFSMLIVIIQVRRHYLNVK